MSDAVLLFITGTAKMKEQRDGRERMTYWYDHWKKHNIARSLWDAAVGKEIDSEN